MQNDTEHLRLLVIFHYIVAALSALMSCIFIIHLVIGIVALAAPERMADSDGSMPPRFFGWMFALIGGLALLMGWIFSLCLAIAGRFLARRQHYVYCLVMAAIGCLSMPFGTVLGVFTIIVLMRPSVREQFQTAAKAV